MKKQKGLTLVGVIVIIIVILFVIAIILPSRPHCRKIANRVICGTNLKGLGTATMVYAHDYDDKYPQLPGTGPWSKRLGFDYYNTAPDFSEGGAEQKVSRTISASLYLLVREADVPPKSFVCPENDYEKWYKRSKPKNYIKFTGENPKCLDLVELWDFGPDPYQHVSYAYQNPYGRFPMNPARPATFAVAADMNPWFKNGDFVKSGPPNQPPQLLTISDSITKEQIKNSNAYHHNYEGQNILWADSHASFEKQPNVGVKNDNIYTFWSTEENPTEQDIQGGTAPTSRSAENDAKSKDDSFLAI